MILLPFKRVAVKDECENIRKFANCKVFKITQKKI